ncbi:hypothetical protein H0O00_04300 [Candidatus Micrarchaeota archaeon]|nr:hypothetical protein [Candidatus Micrarchaeota archaeon]
MADKRLVFTIHVTNRLLERKIPPGEIPMMLKKGARLGDPATGETLCVYKYSADQYYVGDRGRCGADYHHNGLLLQQLAN